MKNWRVIVPIVLLLFACSMASAGTVTLDLTGLQNLEPIGNYFNGGLGGMGSGPGPNYGITFGPDSLAIISALQGGTGNFQSNPSNGPIAFFLSGPGDVMNVAAGFDTGFSFYYSSAGDGSVSVYSGPDGTGSLLAALTLPSNFDSACAPGATTSFCTWNEIGVSFAGMAQSVIFSGAANEVGFDSITMGSPVVPPAVPEPTTLTLLGTGLASLVTLIRKKLSS
jgi:hypothetical protein